MAPSRVSDDCPRSAKVNGVNDHARRRSQETLQTREKRFFLSSIFLAKHKKDTGPSAASASSWVERTPTERIRFFFFPFFLFLAKERMGEERKTLSKIASLCFTAPPSAEPTAACFATPPTRQRSGGGRGSPRSQSQIAPRLGRKRAPGSFA